MSGTQIDEETKRELEHFIEAENQKARFQSAVHNFTDICFEKCITKPGKSMDKSEEACLANCVDRFLDVGNLLLQRLQEGRN